MTEPMHLQAFGRVQMTVERQAADGEESDTRSLSGTIAELEQPSTTQRIVLHAGSLTARQPLDRVKLLRDHNVSDPVGFLTALSEDGLTGTFTVPEGPNGDRALEEARNGLRDGLSVGFAASKFKEDADGNLHILAGELYEVSLVAVPDFAGARIAASAASTLERIDMTPAEQAIESRDVQTSAAPVPVTPEQEAGPVTVQASTAPAFTQPRGFNLSAAVSRIAGAAADLGPARVQQINLALQDVLRTNDAGHGYIDRPDWIGELWSASAVSRPHIEALGAPQALTSTQRTGWRWTQLPTVDVWQGDKTQIPTSSAQTAAVTFESFRVAAGWDFDRIFADLAAPGYIEAFFQAALADYKVKSDRAIWLGPGANAPAGAKGVLQYATSPTGSVTAGGVIALIKQLLRDGRAVPGGSINRLFVGDTLFTQLEDLTVGGTAGVPLWLQSATLTADLRGGVGDVAGLQIILDPSLAATRAVALDTRAVTIREQAPFQVQAIDLPRGGIDLALFAYLMVEVHDPRLVISRTYTAGP
jgi:HK97 family phage prohead protease